MMQRREGFLKTADELSSSSLILRLLSNCCTFYSLLLLLVLHPHEIMRIEDNGKTGNEIMLQTDSFSIVTGMSRFLNHSEFVVDQEEESVKLEVSSPSAELVGLPWPCSPLLMVLDLPGLVRTLLPMGNGS